MAKRTIRVAWGLVVVLAVMLLVTIWLFLLPLSIHFPRIGRLEADRASLQGAVFAGASLADANFSGADLREANLRGATLRGASLYYADLRGADLRQADLRGANLWGAKTGGAVFRGAIYDSQTRWDHGFDPQRHGAMKLERGS